MNSCSTHVLGQKAVINSTLGQQQNCTAAGKVALEELCAHLLPNPGQTQELPSVLLRAWAQGL